MHRIEEIGRGNDIGLLNRSGTLVVHGAWPGRNIRRHVFQPRRIDQLSHRVEELRIGKDFELLFRRGIVCGSWVGRDIGAVGLGTGTRRGSGFFRG